jgi:hypothetical protein
MSGAPDSGNPTDAQQGHGAMTVRGAAFLDVGSMVGPVFSPSSVKPVRLPAQRCGCRS